MLLPFSPPTPEATAALARAAEFAHETEAIGRCLMSIAFWGGAGLLALRWIRTVYAQLRAGNFPRTYVTADSLEKAEALSAAQGDAAEVRPSRLPGIFADVGRRDNQQVVVPPSFFEDP